MRFLPLLVISSVFCACADHRAGRIGQVAPNVDAVQFRTRTELPLGVQRSVDVAVADLDGDGITDMAAADLIGRIVIRAGLGGGEYATREILPVDGKPLAVVAQDLNGDAAPDLTVVSADANVATVFLNQGTANFQRSQVISVEDLPTGMVVGDHTGDSIPDMIVTHLSRSDLLLFPGAGDGTFGPAQSIPIPRGTRTAGLMVADVNQDGLGDILVCDTDNARLVILFGTGGGAGSIAATVPVGATPVGISIGDVDADGKVDIAVSAFDDSRIDLITHVGGDRFELFRSIAVDGSPARSVIADIDDDGFEDLAVCVLNKSAVSIFNGAAGGILDTENQLPATGFPYRPLVADLVGDGRPDLGLVSTNVEHMNVYESTDEGLRSARTVASSTQRPQMVAAADFDGDGREEIVTAGSASGMVTILGATGQALGPVLEEIWSTDVGQQLSNVRAADVDGDGRPDLLLALAGGVKLLANESSPGNLSFRTVPGPASDLLIPGSIPAGMVAADLTGDGRTDLAVAFLGDDTVAVLPGSGQPFAFDAPVVTDVAGRPLGLVAADLDSDGRSEIAVSLATASLVRLFEVTGAGRLEAGLDIPVGAGPTYLATADFDGDGRSDLAVSSSVDLTVLMLFARAGGGFSPLELEIDASPTALVVRDLDLDGFPDLLVTNLDGMSFDVFVSDGLGGIRGRRRFPGVFGATAAVLADVTGSAMADLVVGSSEIDRISVYRNDSVRSDGR
jgi:hypothetical protein